MIKLLAIDLDGTLYNSERLITPRVRAAAVDSLSRGYRTIVPEQCVPWPLPSIAVWPGTTRATSVSLTLTSAYRFEVSAMVSRSEPAMLVTLGEKGVKTLDDLADLAVDELGEVLVAGDDDHVAGVPAQRLHLGAAHRQEGRRPEAPGPERLIAGDRPGRGCRHRRRTFGHPARRRHTGRARARRVPGGPRR